MFRALELSVNAFIEEIKKHKSDMELINSNFRFEHEDGKYFVYFEITDNKQEIE